MDKYIKDIVLRNCDNSSKLKALSNLENDINLAKDIINGKYCYCEDCDDYYLSKSFIIEKETKIDRILVYEDPINSGGNEYSDGKVNYTYKICPKGHKHVLHRIEL